MLEPDAKGVGQINAVKAITRVLAHRVWSDQRRGWRYTNPNLEQLALLRANLSVIGRTRRRSCGLFQGPAGAP